tara:strand:+ start:1318 stop:1659 length:342 start_codon:yes stop_codon:yes gene_type:complete
MAGISEFPKTDGDVYFGYDVNRAGWNVFTAFEQTTLAVTSVTGSVSFAQEMDTILIKNTGSTTCFINLDSAATTSDYTLYAGGTLSIDTNVTAVHAITASGTTDINMIGMGKS